MSLIITDNLHYNNIARVIRNINNTTDTYTPSQMASAIMSLMNYAKISVAVTNAESVSADCGSIHKTGFLQEGRYVFFNCTAGTWVITAIVGGETKTFSVSIPTSGQQFVYNVTFA